MRTDTNHNENTRHAIAILDEQIRLPSKDMDIDRMNEACKVILGEQYSANGTGLTEVKKAVWHNIVKQMKKDSSITNKKKELAQVTHRKITKRMVLAFTLLGLLLVSSIGFAMGLFPWKLELSWTDTAFRVNIVASNSSEKKEIEGKQNIIPTALSSKLNDVLQSYQFSIRLPTWLPDGFVLHSIEDIRTEGVDTTIVANFLHVDGRNIGIELTRYETDEYLTSSVTIEKSDEAIDVLQISGIDRFVYNNLDRAGVMWHEGPYTVIINGNISREEIRNILFSIGE